MAKKETKKNNKTKAKTQAKGKGATQSMPPMGTQSFSGGVPPMGTQSFSGGVPPMGTQSFSGGVPPMGTQSFSTGVPNIPPTATPLDKTQLTADQMTQMQLEEAIKESQDPASKLKKLRSPLRPRSCLLNILFLVLITLALLFIVVAFLVDQFDFGAIFMDMLNKFGIINLWNIIVNWFSNLFSGGAEAAAIFLMM